MRKTLGVAAVLVTLWVSGIATGNLFGGWIHALVIVALAAVIARMLYDLVTLD